MLNLLIAIPMKDTLSPSLKDRMGELVKGLLENPANNHVFDMELALYVDVGAPTPVDAGKWYSQARARNKLIETYLLPEHDLVMWIDADMVEYPADMPARLWSANPDGVTAPMVLVEGTSQFYDTLGFIRDGCRVRAYPPYWPENGELVDLDSVGCTYLIPAEVHRRQRFDSLPVDKLEDHPSVWQTGHTDHWPVMREARRMGMRVACLTSVTAYHADLPKYGERWH